MVRDGDGSSLVDARGCLTAKGIAVLAAAPPGGGPPDLAAHVALCARCQTRLLAGAAGPRSPRRRAPPSLSRTLALAGGILLLLVMALFALRFLAAR